MPTDHTLDGNRARWSTKWDAQDPHVVNHFDGYVDFFFSTAWGPPTNWLASTAPQWPQLDFDLVWLETDLVFAGQMVAHGADNTIRDFDKGAEREQLAALGLDWWWCEHFDDENEADVKVP